MACPTISRPTEADAFLTVLQDTAPRALTACAEWTVHDIGAHLAGTYEEVRRHLRAHAEGHPLTHTRSFEERESPFKRLAPVELLAAVERGEEEMRVEASAIVAAEPDATLAWTGRQMRVDAFLSHPRSECAIHRWDVVGDDALSWSLLGDFSLFKHAISAIGTGPMTARGVAAGASTGGYFSARVRSEGWPDLVVAVDETVSLRLAEPLGEATICADQAARLLMLWGRTPQPASRFEVTGAQDDAFRVRRLLSGY
jgi:hypothetical protein